MDGFLDGLGVQPRPFRALLRTFLALALRGQFYGAATGAKAGELIAPLYWVLAQLLTVSLMLSMLLQARVEAWFYASAHLAATAIFVFGAVVVEFQEAAFDPADIDVVGHRPVTPRTWTMARTVNLAFYVTLIAGSLTLFPTIMGLGLRDTGPLWAVFFPWANLSVAVCAAAGALAIYAAGSAGGPGENLRKVAAWSQIVAILALFYGGQMMLRNASGGVELFAARPPPWVLSLPTTWLGEAVAAGNPLPLAAATGVAGALGAVAFTALRRAWQELSTTRPKVQAIVVRTGSAEGGMAASALGSGPSRAVFDLTLAVLGRDSGMRARNLSSLALPVTSAILGVLTQQYADPAISTGTVALLPIATTVFLAAAMPTVMNNLVFSDDHLVSWRLRAVWGPATRNAARWALLLQLFVPFVAVHTAVLLYVWRSPSAVVHGLISLLTLELLSRLVARSIWAQPILRRPAALGGTLGGVISVVAGVGAAASAIGGVWFLVAPSQAGTVVLIGLLAAGSWAVSRQEAR